MKLSDQKPWHNVMPRVSSVTKLLALLALGVGCLPLAGQSPLDATLRVSAQVQTNPPSITLSWPAHPANVTYQLYRKRREERTWGPPVALGSNVTAYVDTNVVAGGAYEYQVQLVSAVGFYAGESDICAGIEVPLVEFRGKVILIVDDSHAVGLVAELSRLQQDLVGDGWTVLRHDVPRMSVDPANMSPGVGAARSNEVANIK